MVMSWGTCVYGDVNSHVEGRGARDEGMCSSQFK